MNSIKYKNCPLKFVFKAVIDDDDDKMHIFTLAI